MATKVNEYTNKHHHTKLEHAQAIARAEGPRTSKLYDRTSDEYA